MDNSCDDISILKQGTTNTLVITFGGIRQGVGMPVFEFQNILKKYNCHQVFIRDSKQAWYQNGVMGYESIEILKAKLETITNGYPNVIFIGNSMGGFAAIMFGVLLNITKVIAFSPQTFIDRLRRWRYGDKRWSTQIKEVHLSKINKKTNLKNIIRITNHTTIINVYYSNSDKLDKVHAERLNLLENVVLNSYNYGGHNLIKEMRANNELLKVLDEHLL